MIIEYHNHTYYIPIINRKQFIVSVWRLTEIKLFSRNVEMFFQEICEKGIEENSEYIGQGFIDESDPRYQYIKSILSPLIDACVYFSPESEAYFRNIKLKVIDKDEVNAFSTLGDFLDNYLQLGGVVFVYTGLIKFYDMMQKNNNLVNSKEVGWHCFFFLVVHRRCSSP